MSKPNFHNQLSRDFWLQCEGMRAGHREIIMEILRMLDTAGSEGSVKSRHPSRGGYDLLGHVALLEHSINVATICGNRSDDMIIRELAVIAGLAHDCGKLTKIHKGRYTAAMHAHWSAEYLREVIGGRLIDVQAEVVISAVRYHHVAGDGPVHRVLREADGRAREEEILTVLGRITRGGAWR